MNEAEKKEGGRRDAELLKSWDKKILAVCRPDKHSETGASGAERWMNCPGSVALSRGLESRSSIPAMEGTAAHKLGEMVLKEEVSFKDAQGRVIQVEGNGKLYDFVVDDEMVDAVKVYTDYVMYDRPKNTTSEFSAEQTVHLADLLSAFNSKVQLFGRVDANVHIHSCSSILRVIDFKYGKGIPVYAENNLQQMFYALGLLRTYHRLDIDVDDIELVIIQPRCRFKEKPIDLWRRNWSELMQWGRYELIPAALRTEEKDAPLKTGKWCRFCKAKGFCPKIQEESKAGIMAMQQSVSEKSLSDLLTGDVSVIPPTDISSALGRIKTLRKQMKGAEKMMAEFEEKALKRMITEKDIPGYVVGNAASSRTWKDEKSIAVILDLLIPEKGYRQSGLKTVAQIEKLLDKEGHGYEEILKNEIESSVGKPKLTAAVKDKDVFADYVITKPIE